MEKANDAVRGNDRNWITTAAKRWRMESFLLCIKVALPIKLFLERDWSRCWSAKKTERLSFYRCLTRGVWIGILPSDYQMYPRSSLCLNDIDSTDGRASLIFIGFVISECICLFQVCQKGTANKLDIQVIFWGQHINDDAAFRVRTVTQKLTTDAWSRQMEQQSVHMWKFKEDCLDALCERRQLQTAAATLCDVALKCEPRYWSCVY